MTHSSDPTARRDTRLVLAGKQTHFDGGRPVNPPVVRASTVLFDSVQQQLGFRDRRDKDRLFIYGARGNPTAFALEDMVSELEGAYRSRLFPTGLNAIGMALLAYLKPGDHVLIPDAVYEPVRSLARGFLTPYGIEYSFFAADGSGLREAMRPNTRMVYAECPGSLLYEMCDLPEMARIAHDAGALLVCDNTWGSAWRYRPLVLGADVSIMAATKYLGGHSDVMMGTVATTEAAWSALASRCDAFGVTVSPDDAYLVLRGTRTIGVRMDAHARGSQAVANWLQGQQDDIATVFHPGLPDAPGHAIWQRDFSGGNGLLSFELRPHHDRGAAMTFINALTLFGIGASWGGYESVVGLYDIRNARSVASWEGRGPVIRLHIGLEDVEDLKADLDRGFAALHARHR